MNSQSKKVRALGLCSGGLDSMLAGLVLRDQGIVVEWVTFETPFFSSAKARKASQLTGIPLTVRSITPEYMKMLKNPASGYGKAMNPCMDCHALMFKLAGEIMPASGYGKAMNPCMDCHTLMFKLAGEIMKKKGFDFLFSGEVLGQRPMSQTRPSLRYVEKHSGFDGYILRPLSARRLPETIPERQGLVNREQLLDLVGRSRKRQMKLAKNFGIKEYPTPAGGCLLTDKGFSRRLKDFFDHQTTWTENELCLLKFGRHLRVNENTKIIIGRTQDDNQNILTYYDPNADTILKVIDYPGPITLVPRGGKVPGFAPVEVSVTNPKNSQTITVLGIPPKDIQHFMI
jgi:tRNA U34 2-thiouridine synthase MnmA/TrmU